MKHYHMRTRDGERVAWVNDGGRLRRLSGERPEGQTVERIALAVLADAVGGPAAAPWAPAFARHLRSLGPSWDLSIDDIRVWWPGA